jgi:acyl-CoA synthetase (AMP-forming)/AMP-acid ligase II
MQAFQHHGVYVQQAWGMTETSPIASVAKPLPGVSEERCWAICATQGRPVCGVEIRIVDDNGTTLPKDGKTVGELQVRGPSIAGS